MSISLYPPSQPRTMAELLDASFKIFRVSLLKCLPYATLAILAGQLSTLYSLSHGHMPDAHDVNDPAWLVLYAVGGILYVILWTTTLLRQSTVAAGRIASHADLLDVLRNAPAITAITIFCGTATAVLVLPSLALAGPYRTTAFAVMLLLAVFVYFIALSLSLAARMLAHKGVIQSLIYSVELIRGNWWRVVAVYLVGFTIVAVFYLLAGVMAAMVLPNTGGADAAIARTLTATVVLAITAIGLTFATAITLTVFGDLEVRKITRPP